MSNTFLNVAPFAILPQVRFISDLLTPYVMHCVTPFVVIDLGYVHVIWPDVYIYISY